MTVPERYIKRVLVSFRGRCPMQCKHCYTYDLPEREEKEISYIVEETGREEFDIIYLSQKYENFYDEEQGFSLCRDLYFKYHKDIFIITRSHFSDDLVKKLKDLNQEMQKNGNQLYLAVSLCADQSYYITEDREKCPTPLRRLDNLRRAHKHGIKTLMLLRPIFPDAIIPVKECIGLLEQGKDYVNAVVSSGLAVTDSILLRLSLSGEDFNYLPSSDSEYLSDLKGAHYVDVRSELLQIQRGCMERKIPFFLHSMPALNYLATVVREP